MIKSLGQMQGVPRFAQRKAIKTIKDSGHRRNHQRYLVRSAAIRQLCGSSTQENLTILSPSYQSDTAIIFYPGAKVEAEAYLPLLKQIRQTGVTCILVDMPFHMAIFDSNAAEDVMAQFPQIEHWYLAGHSMGGGCIFTPAENCDSIDESGKEASKRIKLPFDRTGGADME